MVKSSRTMVVKTSTLTATQTGSGAVTFAKKKKKEKRSWLAVQVRRPEREVISLLIYIYLKELCFLQSLSPDWLSLVQKMNE